MNGTIGAIRLFAGNFAPRNWAYCDGQLLPISQNTALFSILGTTYGGDGRTTFGLPDLRGRTAIGAGQGPGLNNYRLGQKGGINSVALKASEMPSHSHLITENLTKATNNPLSSNSPADAMLSSAAPIESYATSLANPKKMQNGSIKYTIGKTGGSQAHTNMPPMQGNNYIICLQGLFPSRS